MPRAEMAIGGTQGVLCKIDVDFTGIGRTSDFPGKAGVSSAVAGIMVRIQD